MKSPIRQYDMVVFGATGCTGKAVIVEIVQTLEALPKEQQFTWAIAGRSMSGLEKALQLAENETGKDLSGTNIMIADVKREDSIVEMAKCCKVVVNCVGPYTLYGEPVVRACVDEGTHHVDISAEALFNCQMLKKYHQTAEENGALIVGACGYCCIPSDYGAAYLENSFDGELSSVDSIQAMGTDNLLNLKVHYGTYHSILLLAHRFFQLNAFKKEIFSEEPKFEQRQAFKPLHFNQDLKQWCVMFPNPDQSYVETTQHLRIVNKRSPFQTQIHFQAPNLVWAILLLIFQLILPFIMYFKLFLNFGLNHPKLCTLGIITRQEPTKEENDVEFSWTLIGKGWDASTTKLDNYKRFPPNKKLILKMKGRNPAYGATSTMLVQSAVTILQEMDKIPLKGGVVTPGFAFADTQLAARMHKRGFTFHLEKPIITSPQ